MSIYNSDPEKILVTRLINGNESAFCKLYALYKNRLICFAMKFVKSRELAEDIFQDTFTAIWQNREFLDPELPFAPYVYTITKNRLLNLLHNIERDQKLKNHLLSGAIDFSNDTENSILSTDLSQLLDRALQLLTPQQRRVFEMSRTEMKSHKEIAQELNISVYTVQQHISASLKVIKDFLFKYGGTCSGLLLLLLSFK